MSNHVCPHMRLYSTVLRVRSLARSIEWYERVLGFRVVYRDLSYKLVMVAREDGLTATLWELEPGVPLTTCNVHGSYLVFASSDIECSHRMLTGNGGQPEPIYGDRGLRIFWITDPDGHRQCVLQFLQE